MYLAVTVILIVIYQYKDSALFICYNDAPQSWHNSERCNEEGVLLLTPPVVFVFNRNRNDFFMSWPENQGIFIFFIFLKHCKWTGYLSWLSSLMLCSRFIDTARENKWGINILSQLRLLGHLLYFAIIIMKWQKVYSITLHCIPWPVLGIPHCLIR